MVFIQSSTTCGIRNWFLRISSASGLIGRVWNIPQCIRSLPSLVTQLTHAVVKSFSVCYIPVSDRSFLIGIATFIGGSDPQLYEGDFTYVDVTRKDYWQFKLDGISFDSNEYCKGGCQAYVIEEHFSNQCNAFLFRIADSGTSLLVGPTKEIADLNNKIGATPIPGGEVRKIL